MANSPKEAATKKKTTRSVGTTSSTSSKSSTKTTKKAKKEFNKIAKKNPIGIVVIIGFIIVGLLGGFLGLKVAMGNDTYEMNPYVHEKLSDKVLIDSLYEGLETDDFVVLLLDENYVEPSCKCISIGSDVSSNVEITYSYREDISHEAVVVGKIDTSISGFYYATYSIDNFKYKSVSLIRTIQVMEVENDGQE